MKLLTEYLSVKNANTDIVKQPLQKLIDCNSIDDIINVLRSERFEQVKHNDYYTTTSECFYEIIRNNDVKVFTYHKFADGFSIKYWLRFCNSGDINKSNPVFYIHAINKNEYSYEYEDDDEIKIHKFKTEEEFVKKLKEVFEQ